MGGWRVEGRGWGAAGSPLPWSWEPICPLQLQVLRRDHSNLRSFLLTPKDTNLKGKPMETTNRFMACQRGSGLQIAGQGSPRWFWQGAGAQGPAAHSLAPTLLNGFLWLLVYFSFARGFVPGYGSPCSPLLFACLQQQPKASSGFPPRSNTYLVRQDPKRVVL